MKSLRPVFSGLLAAFLSVLVIAGSLVQALSEGTLRSPAGQATQAAPAPTYAVTLLPGRTQAAQASPTPGSPAAATPTFAHPTTCARPAGWEDYTVQAGDTLAGLARRYQTTADRLETGNCLVTQKLVPGTILAVPQSLAPAPSSTLTPSVVPCGPRPGWVTYTVQRGDTLYSISQEVGATVAEIQFANCMGTSTLIRTNDRLSVPRLPARAAPTRTPPPPQATPTTAVEPSATQEAPTNTPAPTTEPTAEPTAEPTGIPTEAPTAPPTEPAPPDPGTPTEPPTGSS